MSLGGLTTFNLHHAHVEALVRGMSSGFLTSQEMHHLTQAETLSDMRLNLEESDFQGVFADESEALTPSRIQQKATEKLVSELQWLRANAVEPLATFIDFITYEHMIDNAMLLLKGTLNGRDTQELIDSCSPLGMFEESTMRSICAFEANPKGYADLYQTVLVDTPIGKYFAQYLAEVGELRDAGEIQNVLQEMELESIKQSLVKLWLSDFYAYSQSCGGETAEVMGAILKARADRIAINITLNSFGTPLNEPSMRTSERARLYPDIGYLYPEGTARLADVDSESALGAVLESYPPYAKIWAVHASDDGQATIDDAFYSAEVQQLEGAFLGQMQLAVFYAYVKLKQQEVRNLVWVAECIVQGQKDQINAFVPVFSPHSPWRQ